MVQEQRKGDGQHTACLPNPNANLSASVTRPQGPSHDRKKKPRKRNKKKKPVIGVLKSASQQEAAPAKPLQANNVADGSTTVEPHRPSAQNPGDALSVATGRARKRKMQRKINKTRSSDAATLSLSPDADSRPGSDAADGHSGMRRGTRANARVPPIDAEGQTEVSRTERKRKRTQPDEKLPCLLAPAAAPSGSKRKKLRGRKMVRKPQAKACAKRNTEERAAGKCVPDRNEPKTTAVKVEVASESAAHRKAASAKGKRQVAVEKRKLKAREYNKQMKLRTRQKHAKRRKTHEGKTELGANTDSENLQKLASEMAAVTVEVEPPSNPGDVSANWKKLLATEPKTVKNAGVKRKRNATLLNPKWNGVKTPVEGEPKMPDIWFDDVDEFLLDLPSQRAESVPAATTGGDGGAVTSPTSDGQQTKTDPLVKPHSFSGLTRCVAIDCEMVGVGEEKTDSLLARVSLVNQFGGCVYDAYVKPTDAVTDYRTQYSGIRPADIANGEDFKKVQEDVSRMLQGRILVGHAVHHDLQVLFLSHPRKQLRDTSTYKPFRQAVGGGTPSLKKLVNKLLSVSIQEGEHDSVQDARAAMRLYTMVRPQWEKAMKQKTSERVRARGSTETNAVTGEVQRGEKERKMKLFKRQNRKEWEKAAKKRATATIAEPAPEGGTVSRPSGKIRVAAQRNSA